MTKLKKRFGKKERVITQFNLEDGKTQQHFAADCDIHNILKRSGMGEDMSHLARPVLYTGEETAYVDYNEITEKKYFLDQAFQQNLNPYDRESFDNDPKKFAQYLSDPKNMREAIKRGFMVPRPQEPQPEPKAPSQPQSPADKK